MLNLMCKVRNLSITTPGWSTRGFSMSLRHAKVFARHPSEHATFYEIVFFMLEINGARIKFCMTAERNGGSFYFTLEINGVRIKFRVMAKAMAGACL